MKRYLYVLLIVALFALQACATDAAPADAEGALIPPVSSENDPALDGSAGAAPAAGKPGPAGGGTCAANSANAASLATQVIALVNQQRAAAGLGALTSQSQLTTAAQRHSQDMGCNFFMSHTGTDGSTPYSRIFDTGYFTGFSSYYYGENVAAGYATADAVMTAWMNSQPHRDNILSPNFTEIGIGYVYNANDTTNSWYHYWTMALGMHQ